MLIVTDTAVFDNVSLITFDEETLTANITLKCNIEYTHIIQLGSKRDWESMKWQLYKDGKCRTSDHKNNYDGDSVVGTK